MKRLCLTIAGLCQFAHGAASVPERNALYPSDDNIQIRVLLDEPDRSFTIRWAMPEVSIETGERKQKVVAKSLRIEDHGPRFQVSLDKGPSWSTNSLTLRSENAERDVFEYAGRRYRGSLKITKARSSQLFMINLISVGRYLNGMLAAEMNPTWEMEALKAQAIAARSYALHMVLAPKHPLFDLESSVRDQVYRGYDGESSRVRFAVGSTSGIYLSEHAEPSKAHYHSRCGGTTETALAVWNQTAPGGKARVDCPYCRMNPFSWRTSWDRAELLRRLKIKPSVGGELRITGSKKTPSGRIASLQIESEGQTRTLTSDAFRNRLGYTAIKSALFRWKTEGEWIHFEGVGAGHGVGMCQWGARYFAKQGKDYREILAHYYPDLQLREPEHLTISRKN